MTTYDGGLSVRDLEQLRREAKRRRTEQTLAKWRRLWPWAAAGLALALWRLG